MQNDRWSVSHKPYLLSGVEGEKGKLLILLLWMLQQATEESPSWVSIWNDNFLEFVRTSCSFSENVVHIKNSFYFCLLIVQIDHNHLLETTREK